MKLINLFENSIADLQKAIDNQLVMLGGDDDIVIISDVPIISEKQYKRLYRMSFKDETHSNMDPDWGVESEVDISPAFFMVGDYKRWFEHIGETKANMQETIDYARYLELDWALFFTFAVLPNTPIFQTCQIFI